MRRIQYIETDSYRTPTKNTLLETDRDNQSSFTLRCFTHLSINCLSVCLSILGHHKNKGKDREEKLFVCWQNWSGLTIEQRLILPSNCDNRRPWK